MRLAALLRLGWAFWAGVKKGGEGNPQRNHPCQRTESARHAQEDLAVSARRIGLGSGDAVNEARRPSLAIRRAVPPMANGQDALKRRSPSPCHRSSIGSRNLGSADSSPNSGCSHRNNSGRTPGSYLGVHEPEPGLLARPDLDPRARLHLGNLLLRL